MKSSQSKKDLFNEAGLLEKINADRKINGLELINDWAIEKPIVIDAEKIKNFLLDEAGQWTSNFQEIKDHWGKCAPFIIK